MKFFISIENFNFHFWILQDGWTVKILLKNDCNCLKSKFEYEWRKDWSISLFWRDRIRLLILKSSMQSMKTYTMSHDRKSFISSSIVQLRKTRTDIWLHWVRSKVDGTKEWKWTVTQKWTVNPKVEGLEPNYQQPKLWAGRLL